MLRIDGGLRADIRRNVDAGISLGGRKAYDYGMLRGLLNPRRWLAAVDLEPLPMALLALAALAVGVGGYEHAHLFHNGYSEISTIGTLFILNAIGSLVAILVLLARRPLAFVAMSLGISVGSIVAILLTRSSGGLFGFHEAGYDSRAKLTLIAEIAAVLLTLAGAAVARRRLLEDPPPGYGTAEGNEQKVVRA